MHATMNKMCFTVELKIDYNLETGSLSQCFPTKESLDQSEGSLDDYEQGRKNKESSAT